MPPFPLERLEADSKPFCPLLSLPGELRNRIYDYCVESGPIALPPAVHQYAPSRPQFGGLRHASRTLYIEFTPIYLNRSVVSLHPSDVERYLSVVYPRKRDLQDGDSPVIRLESNTCGQIRINLRLSEALDLTPFARLLSHAPNIRVEFARSSALTPVISELTDLIRTIMNASCSVDFNKTVERIIFRYSLRSEIVIKLHQSVLLDGLFNDTTDQSPRQWLRQQGVPVLDHLNIVMESSEAVLRDPPSDAGGPESICRIWMKRNRRARGSISNGVMMRISSLQETR